MARLPQPGSDENAWGQILNDFLTTSLTATGTLKPNVVGRDQLADDAVNADIIADETITEDKLDPDVQAKLNMNAGTPALNDLSDVTIASPANGQALTYQAGAWINGSLTTGVTDHGALTGLADDDHTQYLNNARGDARYYTQSTMDTALAGKAATSHTHSAAQISDSSTTGRSLLTTADAAAAKTTLSLNNVDNTSDATKNSATATLTNKTISGASNTLTNIPQSAVSNLTTDLASKAATSHTHTASQISDSTATGRSVLIATDAAAARTAIGAGTSNLVIGTTSSTAKAGDYVPTKTDVGLGNVDNTSDVTKNAATVTLTNKTISGASNTLTNIPQSAVTNLSSDLTAKAPLASPTFTGKVTTPALQVTTGAGTAGHVLTSDISGNASWAVPPSAPVSSVNGYVGAVTLAKADVGLGNVDNTSDATKNAASATLTNKTISGASNTLTNIPQNAVTNLVTDLAGKQASNADLAAIAALTPVNDDVIQRKAGAWTNRTPAQLKADLGLAKADVGLGNVDNTSDATKNSATAALTNKTISGADNTLSNIPQNAVTNLVTDLASKAATSHTHTAAQISDSTVTGRSVVTAVDAAAARTAIGAGTSNLAIGTTSTTAKAGDYVPTKADIGLGNVDNTSDTTKNAAAVTLTNKTISGASNTLSNIPQSAVTNLTTDLAGKAATSHTHTASQISDSTTVGRSVLVAVDAAAARTAIGAGTSNLALGTTSTTAKAGDYAPTKTDVGLGNVDNTSDATKNAASVTLTNKTISGSSNTLSNIPQSAVTNLTTTYIARNVYDTGSSSYPARPSVTYVEWVGSVDPGVAAQNGDTWVDTST